MKGNKVPHEIPDNATARRMTAAWRYIREQHRLPSTEQLLVYIQDHGYFTEPWSYHERERAKDCARIVRKLGTKFKPRRPQAPDYITLAKEFAEGHEIAYGKNGKVRWTDLHIFLQLVHVCCVEDPQKDGSVPHARLNKLWGFWAKRLGYSAAWDDKKNKAIREFFIDAAILEMHDRNYTTGKAMRWTLGPQHPLYGKVRLIVPVNQDILYEPYILDRLAS